LTFDRSWRPRWSGATTGATLFVLVAALVWVRPLGRAPIDRLMEATEVQVVEQMLTGHVIALPNLPDGSIPEKPPLMHWLAAAGARLFGWRSSDGSLREAIMRLPSALMSLASVVVLWLWSLAHFPESTAVLATLLFLSTYRVASMARTAWVDATFALWVSAAVFVGFDVVSGTLARRGASLARRDPGGAPPAQAGMPPAPVDDRANPTGGRRAALFWACVALATLTKGPLGAGLPLLVLASWCLDRRDPAALRALLAPRAMLIAGLIVAAWYGAAFAEHGYAFLDKQIVRSYFQRFATRDPDSPQAQPWWFFLLYFFPEALPASIVFPFAALDALRGRPRPAAEASHALPGDGADRAGVRRFLALWVLGFVVFFSISAGKRKVYLLPCYPAVALLVADWLVVRLGGLASDKRRIAERVSASVLIAALLWVAMVEPVIDRRNQAEESYRSFARETLAHARDTTVAPSDAAGAVGGEGRASAGEPIYAVGIADYFPLTVYLTPELRYVGNLDDIPESARVVVVAREALAPSARRDDPHAPPPAPPAGWRVVTITRAPHGFARNHPVVLLARS